jgi:hypothetical protein
MNIFDTIYLNILLNYFESKMPREALLRTEKLLSGVTRISFLFELVIRAHMYYFDVFFVFCIIIWEHIRICNI